LALSTGALVFNVPHTISGTGTFSQSSGSVSGADLTIASNANLSFGDHRGPGTTTFQANTLITASGFRLDGGRVLRNEGTLTWNGGQIVFNDTFNGQSGGPGSGTITNAAGATFIVSGDSANSIFAVSFGGTDTGADALINNAGTFRKFGASPGSTTTIAVAFQNSGTVQASSGVLTLQQGLTGPSGTILIDPSGTLVLGAASTVGTLTHNGTASTSLNLGANPITVSVDYNNAAFGTGDAFNRLANVATSGIGNRIVAGGDANQGVSGNGIANGTNTTPTLTLGNVHVGSTAFTYDIVNTGTTGPALRGAIQTGVNGGHITDSRLSGSGVTAGNWGPIATGATLSRDVLFTVSSAGTYAALSGQAVNILNDFDNTRSQLLTLTSSAGAAAYNLATAASVTPSPATVANQRVGGTATVALTVANTAPSGAFTEGLDASFGTLSGAALNNGGSVNLLAGGASNNSVMKVGVDTTTAGAKSGTATIDFASDGTGTSGLGITPLAPQTINVSGTVYRLAAASLHSPEPVTLANQRVGGMLTQALTLSNTAANDGFSEQLSASIAPTSGTVTASGSFLLLNPGASNNSSLLVGVNTTTAGAKTGTATITLQSGGATGVSGLAAVGIGTQTVNVSGNVYNTAVGSTTPTPLVFTNRHVGDAASQLLTVSNTAPAGAFSEALNASFSGSSGNASGSGSVLNLAAGTSNGSTMSVGLDTSSAGARSGTVTIGYQSDGTGPHGNSGLAAIAAGTQVINVSGNVYRLASANTIAPVNFGSVHVGDVVTQALSITNTALNDGFSEKLDASFGGVSDARITTSGSIGLLGAGATNSTSMVVGLNTSNAGNVAGTATVVLTSDGTGTSGLGTTGLPSQSVSVIGSIGNVFRLAQPSAHSPEPVNFGNVRVGTATNQNLTISNTAANDGFSEKLDASMGGATAGITAGGSFTLLAPQATDSTSLHVGIDTTTAGAKSGTATITLASNGQGTSGLGITPLPSQTVNVSGNVYNVAVGSATPTPVVFANRHVGDAASQLLTVSNTAPSGAFSEALNAAFSGTSGNASGSGSVSNLAAGASNSSAMTVNLDTGTAGARSGTVTIGYQSDGTGPNGNSGLSAIAAGTQVINVSGNVYRLAGANTIAPVSFGSVHVGDVVTQALTITNTALNDGFSEKLDASFGAVSDPRITTSGSISLLGAGATNNTSMVIGLNTSAPGNISGTATVLLQSDGAGTSGLGTTSLPSQPVGVTAAIGGVQVFRLAEPSAHTPEPVNFGNVRVGTVTNQNLSITNQAANDGFSEKLDASMGGATAGITAGGSFTLLAPQATDSTSLHVGIDTSTAGAKNGTATITLASNGLGTSGLGITPLPSQTVNVSGNVYRLANPQLNTTSIDLATRVGAPSPTASISVTNTSPDAFTERLNANLGAAPTGFTGSGSIVGLAAGASSSALGVGLSTATAGSFSGSIGVAFVSSGAGTTGAPDASVGSQSVSLTGRVYTPAVATVNTPTVDFGIVHRGDTVTLRGVSVTNSAAIAAPNDVLNGSIGAAPAPFTASGGFAGLAAQDTSPDSMLIGLHTTNAGVFNGTATVSFSSHDAELADLDLGSSAITLKGQVNNFAQAAFAKASGSPVLTHNGNVWTLDFGSITQGTPDPTGGLDVLNAAPAPADDLRGSFDVSGVGSEFALAGFDPFTGVAAGASVHGFLVSLDSANLGSFLDTIVLHGAGSNASGFDGVLDDVDLVLKGNVVSLAAVPEPETWLLMLAGLLTTAGIRRRAGGRTITTREASIAC
jgi:hypothetical protein